MTYRQHLRRAVSLGKFSQLFADRITLPVQYWQAPAEIFRKARQAYRDSLQPKPVEKTVVLSPATPQSELALLTKFLRRLIGASW